MSWPIVTPDSNLIHSHGWRQVIRTTSKHVYVLANFYTNFLELHLKQIMGNGVKKNICNLYLIMLSVMFLPIMNIIRRHSPNLKTPCVPSFKVSCLALRNHFPVEIINIVITFPSKTGAKRGNERLQGLRTPREVLSHWWSASVSLLKSYFSFPQISSLLI